ncbi:ABC transporter permease [Patescibacteria group bacterium]|nr:ABC transporter permease [Patescibacteria group bacterium]MBU1519430.1 ABC transporter permease [Patescibacteria group bacterium]MBU2460840.1 ABC transporter permease [Patescibacteria group bacterium]
MFLQNLKRILRWGAVSFIRNGMVSFSSVLVMVIALFMIGSTILLSVFLTSTLMDMQDKIDVNVYFSVDAPENDILSLKNDLELLPEIASIIFVSKDKALEEFKERHKNDALTIQALQELGENPLRARFNIKAVSPDQYSVIAKMLEEDTVLSSQYGAGFIDKVNYENNKLAIERMKKIMDGAERGGVAVTLVLIFISILITFNTIRLAIYISKEEIDVMKLVGASSIYIRGPFVIAGGLYGVVAALITMGLFWPITLYIKKHTEDLYGGIDLFKYYISNFNEIFLIIFLSGIVLGALSSYLAVRKYLKN